MLSEHLARSHRFVDANFVADPLISRRLLDMLIHLDLLTEGLIRRTNTPARILDLENVAPDQSTAQALCEEFRTFFSASLERDNVVSSPPRGVRQNVSGSPISPATCLQRSTRLFTGDSLHWTIK